MHPFSMTAYPYQGHVGMLPILAGEVGYTPDKNQEPSCYEATMLTTAQNADIFNYNVKAVNWLNPNVRTPPHRVWAA